MIKDIKKNDLYLIVFVIILIITYIFFKIFMVNSTPILQDYARKKTTTIMSKIINESFNDVSSKKKYNDIIEEKNDSLSIESFDINNDKINNMSYLLTNNILNKIKEYENNNDFILYVPIGVIHNIPVLINITPDIPFKINIIGDINTQTFSNVKEYGINNSIIELGISIDMQMQIVLPFTSNNYSITKDIILDSKITNGKIPNYYGNYDTRK